MRILIISQYFWPESFRINDLALALKSKDHKVTVLTGLPNYPAGKIYNGYGIHSVGKEIYRGITVNRVPLVSRGKAKRWRLAANYISFVLFSSLIGPFLCKEKYDIIFVYGPSPFTVGLIGALFRGLKKIPLLFWVQDLWPESLVATNAVRSELIINYVSKMVRFIYKRTDRILIQSMAFTNSVTKAGADPSRICYFPNWAESHYQPLNIDENDPEYAEIPKGFKIMFAGNLGEAQSLETIILAADRLRAIEDIRWIIIGDGRNKRWMHKKIIEFDLKKNIIMLGYRSLEKMPRYLSLADGLLVTLRNDPVFEKTIPSKIQSYLACQKPIIGALGGEGARIIEESNAGYVVPAEDSEKLAESVVRLYNLDCESREQLGSNGRKYYENNFGRERLFTRLEKLMSDTVKEGQCVS